MLSFGLLAIEDAAAKRTAVTSQLVQIHKGNVGRSKEVAVCAPFRLLPNRAHPLDPADIVEMPFGREEPNRRTYCDIDYQPVPTLSTYQSSGPRR